MYTEQKASALSNIFKIVFHRNDDDDDDGDGDGDK